MSIVAAYAVPHPPISIPEVGHGEEEKIERTTRALNEVMRRVAAHQPDVIIFTSPHATLYADYFHISPGLSATGNLAQFNAVSISLRAQYDADLVKRIEKIALRWHLPAGTMGERDKTLDHGTLVPLLFLARTGFSCPVIRIGLSGLTTLDHYRLGQCVAQAVDEMNRRAVFIASGDLSHKLKTDGPYGFAQEGPDFDRQVTEAFASGNFGALLSLSPELAEGAAECGWHSFQMMAGALDQKAVAAELLSYEGPFGVGYGVAAFEVTGTDTDRAFGDQYERARLETLRITKANEDSYVRLARLSLESRVRDSHHAAPPDGLPPELLHVRAGVFVSLKKDGKLRGCIGTIYPTARNIAEEIMQNAVSAGLHDPRFEPVREDELSDLVYSVDVLGQPESIASPSELDPKRYGVIVYNRSKQGLLLPDIEGVSTAQEQIAIAKRKGGIRENEAIRMSRFEVVRHR